MALGLCFQLRIYSRLDDSMSAPTHSPQEAMAMYIRLPLTVPESASNA